MASGPGMLIAYDIDGNVMATLDYLVARDETGRAVGIVDFVALEDAGGRLRLGPDRPHGVWNVPGANGSGSWPEWLGARAHDFRVDVKDGRIVGLIHRDSGKRRSRFLIERAIAKRIRDTPEGEAADLRDLVGGPQKPLRLDGYGESAPQDRGTPIHP